MAGFVTRTAIGARGEADQEALTPPPGAGQASSAGVSGVAEASAGEALATGAAFEP